MRLPCSSTWPVNVRSCDSSASTRDTRLARASPVNTGLGGDWTRWPHLGVDELRPAVREDDALHSAQFLFESVDPSVDRFIALRERRHGGAGQEDQAKKVATHDIPPHPDMPGI